jgi:exosortase/archaeosortase family protein|tara:strand:+ start:573 stop:1451 length:879 start_codon:yes stop_codon:yes gene_type:complete
MPLSILIYIDITVSDNNESVKLDFLSRDEILRGVLFIFSLILIFISFSSVDFMFGISSFLVSIFFFGILFWKGPIAVEPTYLLERYSDNFAYYLDKGELYLCNSFNATKKSEKVLISVGYNFCLVMFFVVPIDLFFQELTKDPNSLLLYQQFLTWVIFVIESALGIGVVISGEYSTRLVYQDMIDLEMVSECTGLHETVFLSLLILCFRGVRPIIRVKWAIYAIIFIFIENLVRIISGYPLIHTFGVSAWETMHYFWWHTGQYALIMSLFVLWIMVVAGNPKNKSIKIEFTE